jgi:hypothetical protein
VETYVGGRLGDQGPTQSPGARSEATFYVVAAARRGPLWAFRLFVMRQKPAGDESEQPSPTIEE